MSDWIADYEIVESIGDPSGGFLARAPARLGGGEVVVHRVPSDASSRATASAHLLAVAGSRAEHLVGLVEIGQGDEGGEGGEVVAYWTTEHPTAISLAEGPSLGTALVLRALAGAARGAHELHEIGLAHGDIRPATVLVMPSGQGLLAVPAPPGHPPGQTAVASPPAGVETVEAAVLAGGPPSRASDLWALGATANRALSGNSPYPGLDADDPLAAVQRVLFGAPVVDPGIPPGPAGLIARCLCADPARRPESALAVATELEVLAGPR
ncbi:MAG: hypothetical protein ACRDY0_01595 [Acidimicrobiales bacterium]